MALQLKKLMNRHLERSSKYFLLGAVCFLVDFFILILFLKFLPKVNYLIASAFSYSVGVILNYITSVRWIFQKRTFKTNWRLEFGIFSIIELSALIFMTASLFLLSGFFLVPVLIAKVMANMVSALYNYIVKYKFLFARNENDVLT